MNVPSFREQGKKYLDPLRAMAKRGNWVQEPDTGVWLGFMLIAMGFGILYYSLGTPIQKQPEVTTLYKELPTGEYVAEGQADNKPQTNDKVIENRLRIPRIGVDSAIYEGDEEQLAFGVWHLPRTAIPGQDSNTVLSAHRWKYPVDDPRSFFDLDELEPGDEIIVEWNGQTHKYRMTSNEVVSPDQVEILSPSDTEQLTLFTCTPVYSTEYRLVIYAEPVNVDTAIKPTSIQLNESHTWQKWQQVLRVMSLTE